MPVPASSIRRVSLSPSRANFDALIGVVGDSGQITDVGGRYLLEDEESEAELSDRLVRVEITRGQRLGESEVVDEVHLGTKLLHGGRELFGCGAVLLKVDQICHHLVGNPSQIFGATR